MCNQPKYEDDFYLLTKMAGVQQIKPNKFLFEGTTFTVNAHVSREVANHFGGKRRAFRLLRHAQMIEHVCSTANKRFLFAVVGKAFDQVSSQYPILRSYYEAARVGGTKHTWMRWTA